MGMPCNMCTLLEGRIIIALENDPIKCDCFHVNAQSLTIWATYFRITARLQMDCTEWMWIGWFFPLLLTICGLKRNSIKNRRRFTVTNPRVSFICPWTSPRSSGVDCFDSVDVSSNSDTLSPVSFLLGICQYLHTVFDVQDSFKISLVRGPFTTTSAFPSEKVNYSCQSEEAPTATLDHLQLSPEFFAGHHWSYGNSRTPEEMVVW